MSKAGRCKDETTAAAAYDATAVEHFGDQARLNFSPARKFADHLIR